MSVVSKVSDQELLAAYSGPAPGANKFVVTIGQPGVRIAFLETHPELQNKAFFQTAVTLHPYDAIALGRLLAEMLREIEKQIIDVEAPSTVEGPSV
jgi:hypothetical protein